MAEAEGPVAKDIIEPFWEQEDRVTIVNDFIKDKPVDPDDAYARRKYNKAPDFGYQFKILSLNLHHFTENPSFVCRKHFPQFAIAFRGRWIDLHLAF